MTRAWLWAAAGLALAGCQPAKPYDPPPEPVQAVASASGGTREGPPRPGGGVAGGTVKDDAPLTVVFQWRLNVARSGRPARETAVGYVRADGTSGGVLLINGEGAVIQPIPGTEGPDAAAVAARWLKSRGWVVR